ncbi:translation initiation factor IF-2 N-terminal domain-containing protein, partial [Enterococcus sp. S157_ASV_20]|nr:translation initiation factor IF-2 N-terminal domain-containing protein [Enterococcus sp. S157_ASV_20]
MGKKRIYELAKEMNKASKDVVDKACLLYTSDAADAHLSVDLG